MSTIEPNDERTWKEYRRELTLAPGEVYLNAGSYSPVPKSVQHAAQEWRTQLASSPMRTLVDAMPQAMHDSRAHLAKYLHGDPASLLLLPNATHAINVAAHSLLLERGSRILITDHEYGAMRFCWQRVARERGYEVDVAALPLRPEHPDQVLDAIRSAVRDTTRVVFFSHVASPSGLIMPAAEICRWARERDIVSVVDGAHAPGLISLSLDDVNADFYAGNCHKWMMTPTGAGFLSVGREFKQRIRPPLTSWGWEFDSSDESDSGWGGSRWSQRVEFQGTTDRTAQLVIPAAIEFRESMGDESVHRRCTYLAKMARVRLEALGLVPILPPGMAAAMTAFEVPNVDPVRAREWMWQHHRISIPFTQAAGQTFLRVSTAWFNIPSEIDALEHALRTVPYRDLGTY